MYSIDLDDNDVDFVHLRLTKNPSYKPFFVVLD